MLCDNFFVWKIVIEYVECVFYCDVYNFIICGFDMFKIC